jgi:DNA-binding response OmpR family regulator
VAVARTILITDDDVAYRLLLAAAFEHAGYRVEEAGSGHEMHAKLAATRPDLLLLDLNLPDEHGLALLRQVRARSALPVVILSVQADGSDRIAGLELGADDYVSKAWPPRELLARVAAVLKRAAPRLQADNGRYLSFAGFRLDTEGHRLIGPDGIDVPLSAAQFRLLTALVRAKGRTLTRDQLLDAYADAADAPGDRTIDVLVSKLRRKLGDDGRKPAIIRTVPNVGYKLADD